MLLGAPAPQRSHTCTTGALRASSRGEADDSVLASGERDRLHAPMPLHIVVPYRDRPEQLALFDAHMHAYLERNGVDDYVVWIIEQSADGRPFNRGAVRNAGVREVIAAYGSPRTVICFHDVDTLPLVDGLPYGEPRAHYAVTHIYGHTHCLGGVLCARAAAIVAADGYPNSLWGWGREDALLEERVARTAGADAIDRSELCERWVSAGFCEVPSGERVISSPVSWEFARRVVTDHPNALPGRRIGPRVGQLQRRRTARVSLTFVRVDSDSSTDRCSLNTS